MVRNLYRTYLYIVCIALLIVVSVAINGLLSTIFLQTPLRGNIQEPTSRSDVVQSVTFAIVAFIVAGLIGGLHYWLLQRDLSADPVSGGGGVRAFFLDISAAVSAIIVIAAFTATLTELGDADNSPAYSLATTFAAAVFYAVVELERRRAPATTRVALAFQRLHLYGVPFITVFIAASYWSSAISVSLDALFGRLGIARACSDPYSPPCYFGTTDARNIFAHWATVLWLFVAWYAYIWLARGDGRSAIRQILHLGSLATGVILVVVGLQRGLEALFRLVEGLQISWVDVAEGGFSFVGPLTFGLIAFAAYLALYRREAELLPTGPVVGFLTLRAVIGLIFAVPFFTGSGLVLEHIIQNAIPAGSKPGPEHLANALALLIAGVGYPPFAISLARESTAPEHSGPRRAFVLILLAGGTITGVVGLVIALRAIITAALGAPLDEWQRVAVDGAVTLVIGGIIAGLYGWLAAREHVFTLPTTQAPVAPSAPAPAEAASVEDVLDELIAGKITRDEAAAQVRQLARAGR